MNMKKWTWNEDEININEHYHKLNKKKIAGCPVIYSNVF